MQISYFKKKIPNITLFVLGHERYIKIIFIILLLTLTSIDNSIDSSFKKAPYFLVLLTGLYNGIIEFQFLKKNLKDIITISTIGLFTNSIINQNSILTCLMPLSIYGITNLVLKNKKVLTPIFTFFLYSTVSLFLLSVLLNFDNQYNLTFQTQNAIIYSLSMIILWLHFYKKDVRIFLILLSAIAIMTNGRANTLQGLLIYLSLIISHIRNKAFIVTATLALFISFNYPQHNKYLLKTNCVRTIVCIEKTNFTKRLELSGSPIEFKYTKDRLKNDGIGTDRFKYIKMYFNKLNLKNYIFGIKKDGLNYHNSFIRSHSNAGILGLTAFTLLILLSLKRLNKHPLYIKTLIVLTIGRGIIDSFLAYSLFTTILYLTIESDNNER